MRWMTAAFGLALTVGGCASFMAPAGWTRRGVGAIDFTGDLRTEKSAEDIGLTWDRLEALKVRCTLRRSDTDQVIAVTEDGAIACNPADEVEVDEGDYALQIEALCQPEVRERIRVDRAHTTTFDVTGRLSAPKPQRLYVREEDSATGLVENSSVDILRLWPDANGECTRAVVRVVETGLDDANGALVEVPRGILGVQPIDGTSPRERRVARDTQQQLVAERAEAEVVESELASGKCDPARSGQLQEAVTTLEATLAAMNDGSHAYRVGGFEVIVTNAQGVPFAFRNPPRSSTAHVIAVGFSPVRLSVNDANGNVIETASGLAPALQHFLRGASLDTRAFRASPLSEVTGKLHGAGCALVLGISAL